MSKRRPSPETPEPGPSKRHKRDKDEEDAEEEESGALNASQRPDFVYNATMAVSFQHIHNFTCMYLAFSPGTYPSRSQGVILIP